MKKIVLSMVVFLSAFTAQAGVTVNLEPETQVLAVKVVSGFYTGCGGRELNLVGQIKDGKLLVSEDRTAALLLRAQLDKVMSVLDEDAQRDVRRALFPRTGPIFTCQAEVRDHGEFFVRVNTHGGFDDVLEVELDQDQSFPRLSIEGVQQF